MKPGRACLAARDDYMTVEDLSGALQVHEDTVRGMLARGDLPGLHLGRRWYVRRAAFDALFAKVEQEMDRGTTPE